LSGALNVYATAFCDNAVSSREEAMVEKVITSPENVIELARYQTPHNAADRVLAISARVCRHCGAALLEGESESECSSAPNIDASGLHGGPRKSRAE